MQQYGLLAHPVKHSLSPIIHNAGFRAANILAKYTAYDVRPERLDLFFEKVKEERIGLSVSMPYKEKISHFCGEVSLVAKKIKAINTIYWRNGKMIGHNTDVMGIKKPLLERVDHLDEKNIVILGAGGAARSAAYAAVFSGAEVKILNRTVETAKQIAEEFECEYGSLDDYDKDWADIVIQTTSVGMMSTDSLLEEKDFREGQIVFDVIYRPIETEFIKRAKAAGADIITGDEMFLIQAFEQFKIFTGKDAPVDVMKQAFYETLETLDGEED